MDTLLEFATLAGVLLTGFWAADRRRYVFVIDIRAGVSRVRRGKATAAFVDQVSQLCREHKVQRGWIGGIRQRLHVKLAFSRSVPQACRQRVRNVWQLT